MPIDSDIEAGYGGYGGGGYNGNPRGESSGFSGGGWNSVTEGGGGNPMRRGDRLMGLLRNNPQLMEVVKNNFPFMFGIPSSQVTPNFMPQITPPQAGNPQNLNDLYSMYGVGANQPMPVTPNVPPPPVSPVEQPVTSLPNGMMPFGPIWR